MQILFVETLINNATIACKQYFLRWN